MNELQRMQYLDAMGVDTYMPRWILPGAPAPRQCDVSFIPAQLEQGQQQGINPAPLHSASLEARSTQAPSLHPAVAAKPSPDKSSLTDTAVLDTLRSPASWVKDGSKAEIPVVAAESEPVVTVSVEFALSIWRVSPQLMVIDSRQSRLALPTEPLLMNILAALGYPLQPLPKAEILRWPLLDNPYIGTAATDAREWLETFLEARLHAQPVDYILLMGEAAATYVLPEGQIYSDSLGQQVALEGPKSQALVVPGLSDMLLQPELKAQTWQTIQPLRIDAHALASPGAPG